MKTKVLVSFSAITLFITLGIAIQAFPQNSQPTSASKIDAKAQVKVLDRYGKLPLSFEANRGQTDSQVKFLSRGPAIRYF
jgi:hypothetical protein